MTAALLHELPLLAAQRTPDARALTYGAATLNYGELSDAIGRCAHGLLGLGLQRGERVGIYLEKRFETVIAAFGASAAGLVFVPVNPILKAEQVRHILADCNVRVLLTSPERLAGLLPALAECPDLHTLVVTGDAAPSDVLPPHLSGLAWNALLAAPTRTAHSVIDSDMAAILYTSGSTGRPKGVVLSHRNMVVGARSVASYLENHANDSLLAALPLSFDAGLSQLTTAFHAGARVVLLNYLMPRDVLKSLDAEAITGLTAVPPLYIQLTQLAWAEDVSQRLNQQLRYFANTGGRMPGETLKVLRSRLPDVQPFLMYGLTEAFRSTYLPPAQADARPDSIGKAIPNAEILVLRPDGTPCAPNEPGELVHRGPLVAQGYWNDPEKTAERFRPLPIGAGGRSHGQPLPEYAVFSGDTVKQDAEGYLYFIGRLDEMIKTSGYRVSPTEVEEALYATGLVGECCAFGVPDATLGAAIHVVATGNGGAPLDAAALLAECRRSLPAYMVPARIVQHSGPLPRNANGKIDRPRLRQEHEGG